MTDQRSFLKFQASLTKTSYVYNMLNRTQDLQAAKDASTYIAREVIFENVTNRCFLAIDENNDLISVNIEKLASDIRKESMDRKSYSVQEFMTRTYPRLVLDIQNLTIIASSIFEFNDNPHPDPTDYSKYIHLLLYTISTDLYRKCCEDYQFYITCSYTDEEEQEKNIETLVDIYNETAALFELMISDKEALGDTIILATKDSVVNWRIQLSDYYPIDYMTVLKDFCHCVRWNKHYYFMSDDFANTDIMDSLVGNTDKTILVGIYETPIETIKFTMVDKEYLTFNDPKDPAILDLIRSKFAIDDDDNESIKHNESQCTMFMSTKADFHYQNIYLNTFQTNYLAKKCYFFFNETTNSALDASSSIISFEYTPSKYMAKIEINLERNKPAEEETIDHTYAQYRLEDAQGNTLFLPKVYRIDFTYISKVMRDSIERLVRETAAEIWDHRVPLYRIIQSIEWEHKPKASEVLRQATTNYISKKYSILSPKISLTMANNKFTTTRDNRPVYVSDLDLAVSLSKEIIMNRQRLIALKDVGDISAKVFYELDIYRNNPELFKYDEETLYNSIYVPYYIENTTGVRTYDVCNLEEFGESLNLANNIDFIRSDVDADRFAELIARTYCPNFYALSFTGNFSKNSIVNNCTVVNRLHGGIILHTRSSDIEQDSININDFDLDTTLMDNLNGKLFNANLDNAYYFIKYFDVRYTARSTFKKFLEKYEDPGTRSREMICKEEMFGFTNTEIKNTFDEPDYDTMIHIKYLEYRTQSTIFVFKYDASNNTLDYEFPRHSLYYTKNITYINNYLFVIKVAYLDGTFNYCFPTDEPTTFGFPITICTDYLMEMYNRRCIRVPLPTSLPARVDVRVSNARQLIRTLGKLGYSVVGQLLDEHGKVHALDLQVNDVVLDPTYFDQETIGKVIPTPLAHFTIMLDIPVEFNVDLNVSETFKYFPRNFIGQLDGGNEEKSGARMPNRYVIPEVGYIMFKEFSKVPTEKVDLTRVQFIVLTMFSLVLWVSSRSNIEPEGVIAEFADVVPDNQINFIEYLTLLEKLDILPTIKKSIFSPGVDASNFFTNRITLPQSEYDKLLVQVKKELPYGILHSRNQGFAFYMENTSIQAADVLYLTSLRNSKNNRISWYPIISIDDSKVTMTSLENKSSRFLRNASEEYMMIKLVDSKVRTDLVFNTVKEFVDDCANTPGIPLNQEMYVGIANKPVEANRIQLHDAAIKFVMIPIPQWTR